MLPLQIRSAKLFSELTNLHYLYKLVVNNKNEVESEVKFSWKSVKTLVRNSIKFFRREITEVPEWKTVFIQSKKIPFPPKRKMIFLIYIPVLLSNLFKMISHQTSCLLINPQMRY